MGKKGAAPVPAAADLAVADIGLFPLTGGFNFAARFSDVCKVSSACPQPACAARVHAVPVSQRVVVVGHRLPSESAREAKAEAADEVRCWPRSGACAVVGCTCLRRRMRTSPWSPEPTTVAEPRPATRGTLRRVTHDLGNVWPLG